MTCTIQQTCRCFQCVLYHTLHNFYILVIVLAFKFILLMHDNIMRQISLVVCIQEIVMFDLFTGALECLANVYVLAIGLLEDIILAHGVDAVMEEVLIQNFKPIALRWHKCLSPSVARSHLVKEKPLVHQSLLVLLDSLTELLNDRVLANHFLHLLFDHGFLGFQSKLVLSGNLDAIFIDLSVQFDAVLAFQIVHNFILPVLYILCYFLILESLCLLDSVLILQLLD